MNSIISYILILYCAAAIFFWYEGWVLVLKTYIYAIFIMVFVIYCHDYSYCFSYFISANNADLIHCFKVIFLYAALALISVCKSLSIWNVIRCFFCFLFFSSVISAIFSYFPYNTYKTYLYVLSY